MSLEVLCRLSEPWGPHVAVAADGRWAAADDLGVLLLEGPRLAREIPCPGALGLRFDGPWLLAAPHLIAPDGTWTTIPCPRDLELVRAEFTTGPRQIPVQPDGPRPGPLILATFARPRRGLDAPGVDPPACALRALGRDGQVLATAACERRPTALAVSPDLIAVGDVTLRVGSGLGALALWTEQALAFGALAILPDGRVAAGDAGGVVSVWRDGVREWQEVAHTGPVTGLAFASGRLWSAGRDGFLVSHAPVDGGGGERLALPGALVGLSAAGRHVAVSVDADVPSLVLLRW